MHTSRGHADIVEEEEEAFRITTFSIRFFLETDSQGKEDEVDPNSKDPSPFGMKLRFERLAEQWPKDALVAEVRPGSLAEVCGVRSNDQIIKIDGIDVRGLKFAAIVRRLRYCGFLLAVFLFLWCNRITAETVELECITLRLSAASASMTTTTTT